MTTELKHLELDEVSLVDAGDDPLAKVAIFKRKQEEDMDKDEVIKGLEADLEALKVEKATLETQADADKATIEALEKALEETVEKTAPETIEVEGETILKSTVPAVILKKLEDVAKAKVAEDLRKAADKTIPNFKGTADQRSRLMKMVGEDKELLEMLSAANALFAEAFQEVGKTDANADSQEPDEALNSMVKAYEAQHKVGFYQAYEAVAKTKEGKALLMKTYKK